MDEAVTTSQVSFDDFLIEAAQAEALGVDTEGTALKTKENDYQGTDYRDGTGFAYGISVAWRYRGELKSAYWAIKHTDGNISEHEFNQLRYLIENHQRIIFHNAQHDLYALETLGIFVKDNWYCTLLMVHFIDENIVNKKLEAIARKLLGKGKANDAEFQAFLLIFGWTPEFPVAIMRKYARVDAELTLECWEILIIEFIKQGFHDEY